MKRSQINTLISEAIDFTKKMNFMLPPFAYWSADDWKTKGNEYEEIFDNLLGWDITDFGSGDFERIGLLLFTMRNGSAAIPEYSKPYAEKLMIVKENQVTPYHFHYNKMEDIINRGGGNLVIRLYNSLGEDCSHLDKKTDVKVSSDGRNYTLPAGSELKVMPGESITLLPRLYHSFWAEEGSGAVMAGEVSSVNDDNSDNHFLEKDGRFPEIIEDATVRYLTCKDYRKDCNTNK